MTKSRPLDTALAWVEALNARDKERLGALSAEGIEIASPRASVRGRAELLRWVDEVGARFEIKQSLQHGAQIVLELVGTWTAAAGQGSQAPLAMILEVESARVSAMRRYPDLQTALQSAGGRE